MGDLASLRYHPHSTTQAAQSATHQNTASCRGRVKERPLWGMARASSLGLPKSNTCTCAHVSGLRNDQAYSEDREVRRRTENHAIESTSDAVLMLFVKWKLS